jgi:hypothetical protein
MRDLPTPIVTAVTGNSFSPIILLDLTLSSGVAHVWSGIGSLAWNSNTYLGIGSLGSVGDISEGVEVRADGTTITLSGIDPTLLNDCLNDIQLGAPATIWFGVLSDGQISGSPYSIFVGTVDKPVIPISPDNLTITLSLENRMLNLQRPTMRRYTSADQMYVYPTDIGFAWVEMLNDTSLVWG